MLGSCCPGGWPFKGPAQQRLLLTGQLLSVSGKCAKSQQQRQKQLKFPFARIKTLLEWIFMNVDPHPQLTCAGGGWRAECVLSSRVTPPTIKQSDHHQGSFIVVRPVYLFWRNLKFRLNIRDSIKTFHFANVSIQ